MYIKRRPKHRTGKKTRKHVLRKQLNGLERRFERILIKLGIPYKTQYVVTIKGRSRVYDFYIPSKRTLIEVDGDYWHCNPKKYPKGPVNKMQRENIHNDKYKNELAQLFNYKLIRFWEHDINNRSTLVRNSLKFHLGID